MIKEARFWPFYTPPTYISYHIQLLYRNNTIVGISKLCPSKLPTKSTNDHGIKIKYWDSEISLKIRIECDEVVGPLPMYSAYKVIAQLVAAGAVRTTVRSLSDY